MVLLLAFLAGLPLIGWVVTAGLAVVVTWVGVNILNTVQLSIMHLLFFGLGIFMLFKFVDQLGMKGVSDEKLAALAIIGVALIILGFPNLVFSLAGQPSLGYSIVPLK